MFPVAAMLVILTRPTFAAEISLESSPPVVVKTEPAAGATGVDPRTSEIVVQFSKQMMDGSWSWATWGEENFPEMVGQPKYLADGRTCVLKVKLQPGKFYATWLNSDKFKNFKDPAGRPAVPYLLTFTTASTSPGSGNVSAGSFGHSVKPGDTLSKIVTVYREKGAEVTIDDVVKANPGLDPARMRVGQTILIPGKAPDVDKTTTAPKPRFVRVVLDDNRMTFEGQSASWDKLDTLLSAVPERERTVLEWAVPSTQITIQEQNDWSFRFAELARKHGFVYSSYVGVHPFRPKGGAQPVAQATAKSAVSEPDMVLLLNDDQKAVLAWTDRQFRSFFDARPFDGWSESERAELETKLMDALKGPQSREYFQAINTLGAMRSTKALPALRSIAYDRADKNNRDRWMAIRALGLIGDKADVPGLSHLVYHGNVNTRWWAQISLVRITGQNFGKDWNAWGKWWNDQSGEPPFKPEIIRWWDGQAEPDQLAESLEENDRKFFEGLKPKSAAAPAPTSSTDVAARLRNTTPLH